MNIERAKSELADFYYRQLENGFPPGSMAQIRNTVTILSRAAGVDFDVMLSDIRRTATTRLSISKRCERKL